MERMWQWRKESGDTILMQLREAGLQLRLDENALYDGLRMLRAVRTAFVRLLMKSHLSRARNG